MFSPSSDDLLIHEVLDGLILVLHEGLLHEHDLWYHFDSRPSTIFSRILGFFRWLPIRRGITAFCFSTSSTGTASRGHVERVGRGDVQGRGRCTAPGTLRPRHEISVSHNTSTMARSAVEGL